MTNTGKTISIKKCPHHMPEGWEPPVPAWTAKMDASVSTTALYIGVQNPDDAAVWAVKALLAKAGCSDAEHASFTDRVGVFNRVLITYLPQDAVFSIWRQTSGLDAFLNDPAHLQAGYGLWCEAYTFQPGQFETMFSTPDGLEGYGKSAAQETIGPIREHAYWGGVEDRIPNARPGTTEPGLLEMPVPQKHQTRGKRIDVAGPHNLCLIRSGQDLRSVTGEEREDYDTKIEPALSKGLAFLAETPSTGCFDSRYMKHCSAEGEPIDKTFGMQTFMSIEQLMEWAKSHPTHLAIFTRFQAMAERLEGQFDLRLWHEVAVMPSGSTSAIYVNCHEQTGLLPYTGELLSRGT